MPADKKAGAEIGEEDQPEHDIQHFDQPVARRERGRDNERQRRQVQYEKAVTEPAGFRRVAFIQIPQPVLETFNATETCNEFPTPHASPQGSGKRYRSGLAEHSERGPMPLWVRSRYSHLNKPCRLWPR